MQRIATVCLFISAFAATSHASTITFITPTGSTTSGGPVSASATVTTSAGQIVISLTDLLANPSDVAQLVSDFDFVLSNGATTGTLVSQVGQQIDVHADGTTSNHPGNPTGWQLNSNVGGGIQISALGGGQPYDLIIGPPGPGGVYTAANGSIAGNGPHNPFINQTGTFTINIAGVTAATTVTSATFSFGTTAGVDIPGVPTTTPEPATLASVGIGLLFLGFAGRMRKRSVSAVK
jgi:hypothetical protein